MFGLAVGLNVFFGVANLVLVVEGGRWYNGLGAVVSLVTLIALLTHTS